MQASLNQMGTLAPIIYVTLYTLATLLILSSITLNLTAGTLLCTWWRTLLTTIAAILAAILSFAFTSTLGRKYITQKLAVKRAAMDVEISQGGLFYLFVIRLLPIIPYGIVHLTAGLTSILFRDYLIGTTLGTILGILSFIMIEAGFRSLNQGNIFPLLCGFKLTGILVVVSTWYSHRCQPPRLNEGKR